MIMCTSLKKMFITEHKKYIHPEADNKEQEYLKETTYSIHYPAEKFSNYILNQLYLEDLELFYKTIGQLLKEKGVTV